MCLKLLLLLGVLSLSLCQKFMLIKTFPLVLNNRTMSLAGQLSLSTNNIVYYDTIAPDQRNQSLYTFNLNTKQKQRMNESYYVSAWNDLKGGAKQRYVVAAEQIPDWSFRTLRMVLYTREDMAYVTYAYTTLEMDSILGMATYFLKDQNNQTLKDQFNFAVITSKGNLCSWTFNIYDKIITDKICVPAHSSSSGCIASAGDNKHIITGGGDGAMRLWDLTKQIFSWVQTKPITAITVSNNQLVFNGDSSGVIRIYNLTNYKAYKFSNITDHKDRILSLSVSQNSKYLASCSNDGYLMLWNIQTGTNFLKNKFQKNSSVLQVLFATTNYHPTDNYQIDPVQYLYTSHADGSIQVWQIFINQNNDQIQLNKERSQNLQSQ